VPQRKERIKLKCVECGKEFHLLPCQIKSTSKIKRGRFCSKLCMENSRRNGSNLFCALCDTMFYRRFGEQDIGVRVKQFCSKKCYMEWRRINSKDTTYLKDGAIHIHRIVAESVIGRKLLCDEVVHHIDGDKHNNHPSNLALFPNKTIHAKCHAKGIDNAELSRFSIQKISTIGQLRNEGKRSKTTG
jgi:hypothetical protein